ncbi:MAG: hypothetical protein ACE5I2_03180 [Anaerolineae bacterium]
MQRPLWRILMDMQKSEPTPLTEAECVALLEFLAEEVMAGCDPETLKALIARCLAQTPLRSSGPVSPERQSRQT